MPSLPSIFERNWPTVILTPIAVANSIVTVSDTAGLHTKQIVVLSLAGVQDKFQIKRILSDTQLQVGDPDDGILAVMNPVGFNGGMLTMSEQPRNKFGSDLVLRSVYEEEPAVALRNVLVNAHGAHIDSVVDSNGVTRLATDANVDVTVNSVGLFTLPYDSILPAYPSATVEQYQSYTGGLSGTPVQLVTVTYTDSTKRVIASVVRTPQN